MDCKTLLVCYSGPPRIVDVPLFFPFTIAQRRAGQEPKRIERSAEGALHLASGVREMTEDELAYIAETDPALRGRIVEAVKRRRKPRAVAAAAPAAPRAKPKPKTEAEG